MPRNDNTKFFLLRVIFTNCRLKEYQYYIRLAQEKKYKVCSMEQFWAEKESDKKHFVLRHDVDHITKGTRKMYEAEKECGVVSTYYFRHSTMDIPLMSEMQQNGYEVGLHYETLSDYAEERGLDSVEDEDIRICRERLKKEIQDFKNHLPKPVKSICSHGAPANKRICCSNNVLLEGECYGDYGILFEAYDKVMYEKYVDEHIMDNTLGINYGFSYASNPIDAIEKGSQNIVFLAHPNHWYQSFSRSIKDLLKLLLGRCTYKSDQNFVRILDEHINVGEKINREGNVEEIRREN